MSLHKLRSNIPTALALIGFVILIFGFFGQSIYRNIILGSGLFFMFLAWLEANLQKGILHMGKREWHERRKVLFAMTAVALTGFVLLCFYELKIPKYEVAIIKKELYRVPPQLSKNQLVELGRECNTFGNTLCSHDVFAKVVQLDPRNYKALANLAMAQSHLGFHEFAVTNFQRAIHSGVQSYDVYKFYGHSLKAKKELNKAIKAYEKSLALNPNQVSLKQKVNEFRMSHSETKAKLSQ